MYQLSVLVHVVSAMVWVGGMLFLALVAAPATRHLPPAERGALFSVLGRRFRVVGWTSIAILVATGLLNVRFRGIGWEAVVSGRLFGSEFGRVLAAKLGLVAAMLVVAAVHDVVLGPASVRASAGTGPVAFGQAATLRRRASLLARLNAVLALLVVALAVALVRGLPW